METQPPDPEIEKLFAELRSGDPIRQRAAAEKIAERKVLNAEIISVIKTLAQTHPDATVRYWADQSLTMSGATKLSLVPGPHSVSSSAKVVEPLSRRAKIVQFTIGFVGWYVVNGAIWLGLAKQGGTPFIVVLPINLIVLIFLALTWRWVALGLLSAMVLNIAISISLGLGSDSFILIPFFNVPLLAPG